jgi:hypothetical protein
MRRVLFSLLMAMGCAGGATTEPAVATVAVRIRDDAGKAAGVHQVVVTTPSGASASYRSAADGTLTIRLQETGTVTLRVVPRAQFVGGTPGLARTVTVDEGRTARVDVTVYRLGGPIDFTPTGI